MIEEDKMMATTTSWLLKDWLLVAVAVFSMVTGWCVCWAARWLCTFDNEKDEEFWKRVAKQLSHEEEQPDTGKKHHLAQKFEGNMKPTGNSCLCMPHSSKFFHVKLLHYTVLD